MGYINIDGQARVFVQTGVDNTPQDARKNAEALSQSLKGVKTGYINNGTEGIPGDVGEFLPNSVSKKDVINEYTYRTLNAQGPTLIALHSAGNEDARKALQMGALYGHEYSNLSFISLGSPVSSKVMRQNITHAGGTYLGSVGDWRDPVTYSKTAGGSALGLTAAGAIAGAQAGATYAAPWGIGAGPLGVFATGLIGGAVGGAVGGGLILFGSSAYHTFPKYISKPQSQSIMFDWLKKNPQVK